jgi:transcriptional regulator with XRE-family HTH domain
MVRKSSDSLRHVLAQNIKAFRKTKGISQEELAERCGLHRTYIGSVEREERNVTLSTLEVLSDALQVNVASLFIDTRIQKAPKRDLFMGNEDQEIEGIIAALKKLTPSQRKWVKLTIAAFDLPKDFQRAADSDVVNQVLLEHLGDQLLSHHATSRQALSKDRFEFAFEAALNEAGIPSQLVQSRTNRGHDIMIGDTPVSLKTEAAANIREETIYISKWMELGKGTWELPILRDLFLEHVQNYERIFTLRCLSNKPTKIWYELVEIPKVLLLEALTCDFEVKTDSRQNPQPGYGYVRDVTGQLNFSLYFDGGSERKLQIKGLRKDLCKVHAVWIFSTALE